MGFVLLASIPSQQRATDVGPAQNIVQLERPLLPDRIARRKKLAILFCSFSLPHNGIPKLCETYGIGITVPTNSSQMSRKWKGDPTFSLDDITFESITIESKTGKQNSTVLE